MITVGGGTGEREFPEMIDLLDNLKRIPEILERLDNIEKILIKEEKKKQEKLDELPYYRPDHTS